MHSPEVGMPQQADIPRNGYAIQCRITTEDPENKFVPDYGRILAYRSPSGFGVRLDGGMGYAGAAITPFYDSLLVKCITSGQTFDLALSRARRCLSEFRIRGVKTNIPFLENVIANPQFRSGEATTIGKNAAAARSWTSSRKGGAKGMRGRPHWVRRG